MSPCPYDEYLRRLAASDERLEYVDGEIFAMAGGTPAHSYVGARVTTLLGVALQGGPCRTFSSDLRVQVQGHRPARRHGDLRPPRGR
ncbi:MAG: Uma2 family endonuclease [Deltaproteobacteria bacterium]|nr:Uma2 family endonuclease [Deltaproteobacteria bacterium]